MGSIHQPLSSGAVATANDTLGRRPRHAIVCSSLTRCTHSTNPRADRAASSPCPARRGREETVPGGFWAFRHGWNCSPESRCHRHRCHYHGYIPIPCWGSGHTARQVPVSPAHASYFSQLDWTRFHWQHRMFRAPSASGVCTMCSKYSQEAVNHFLEANSRRRGTHLHPVPEPLPFLPSTVRLASQNTLLSFGRDVSSIYIDPW